MRKRIIALLFLFTTCNKYLVSQNDSLLKPLRLVGVASIVSGNKYRSVNTGPYFTLYYKNNEVSLGLLFSGLSTDTRQNNARSIMFSYQYFFNIVFPIKVGVYYMLSHQAYTFRSDYAFTNVNFPNAIQIHTIIENNTFLENYIGGCFREKLFKHIVLEQFIGLGLSKFTYIKNSSLIGENTKSISNYFSGMIRIGIGYKF